MGGNAGKGKKPERTMKNSNGGAGAPMRGWRGRDENDKHDSIIIIHAAAPKNTCHK